MRCEQCKRQFEPLKYGGGKANKFCTPRCKTNWWNDEKQGRHAATETQQQPKGEECS